MKRQITLILVLFLVAGGLTAQQDPVPGNEKSKKNILFSASSAYSIPLGNYAGFDKTNQLSGYAGGGFMVSIGLDWMGKRGLGLGITYVFQYNSLKDTARDVMPEGHLYTLGTQPWNNHYVIAGPVYVHSFGNFSVEARMMAGIVIAQSSNFSITLPAQDSLSQITTSQGAGMGFAIRLMAGVGYRLSKRVSLFANITYLGASPSRTKDYYYYSYVNDPVLGLIPVYQGAEFKIKKKISTFNPGIGVTIKL